MDDLEKKEFVPIKIKFSLTIKDVEEEIGDENVSLFSIVYDYINNKAPLYLLKILIPTAVYNKLNALLTPFKPVLEGIDLRLMYVEDIENINSDNEDDYIVFRTYNSMSGIVDNVRDIDETDLETMDVINDKLTDSQHVEVNIILFDKDEIGYANKGYVNGCIPNGNVAQAIYESVNSCVNDNLKIYVEQPHNSESYENLVIPPMGFDEALNYIDNEYNIYRYTHNFFIRDKVMYILPLDGTLNTDSQLKYYIDIRNLQDNESDDYLNTADDEIVSIMMNKDSVSRNKIYNIKHTLYGYIGKDKIRIPEVKNSTLLYDRYKIEMATSSVRDIKESIKNRLISLPLKVVPLDYDVYPHTMFKLINERVEGEYRVAKYTEVYTKTDYNKLVELYDVL